MHLLLACALLVVVGAGVYVKSHVTSSHVLGTSTTTSPTPSPSVSNTPTPQPTAIPTPLATSPSATPSPRPPLSTSTPKPTSTTSIEISAWVYPGATSIGSSEYTSSDSPQVITNWYKAKLRQLNYSVNSFVTTTANEQVKNRLVASSGPRTIDVEITQSSSGQPVKIKLIVQ